MNYCGIDLASKSSYIHLTDEEGIKMASGEIPTTYMAKSPEGEGLQTE